MIVFLALGASIGGRRPPTTTSACELGLQNIPFYEGKTPESPTRISVWEKGASIASLTQSNARHRTEVQRLPMGGDGVKLIPTSLGL
jgi:hypothetical protein